MALRGHSPKDIINGDVNGSARMHQDSAHPEPQGKSRCAQHTYSD
jgi:hypothetical protein